MLKKLEQKTESEPLEYEDPEADRVAPLEGDSGSSEVNERACTMPTFLLHTLFFFFFSSTVVGSI